MNTTKNILSLMILLLSTTMAYAQKPFLDTVYVRIDNRMELELATSNFKDLNGKVEQDVKSLQTILRESNAIPEGASYTITYIPGKLVSIKQSGQKEWIIWKDSGSFKYPLDKQCIINSDSYYLLLRFSDIENLTSESLIPKINKVLAATDSLQGRFAATFNYTFTGDKLVHNKQYDKLNGQLDVLTLEGGIGANLIKNQPVVDLSAKIGLIFSKNGILKNNYYVSYNLLSIFDDEPKIKLNGFANAGYRYNLSNDIKKPNWLGVELGYLVNRSGDFLDKNTFRLGINWDIGKYMSVSPQLYISKNATFPAIRIGFGL